MVWREPVPVGSFRKTGGGCTGVALGGRNMRVKSPVSAAVGGGAEVGDTVGSFRKTGSGLVTGLGSFRRTGGGCTGGTLGGRNMRVNSPGSGPVGGGPEGSTVGSFGKTGLSTVTGLGSFRKTEGGCTGGALGGRNIRVNSLGSGAAGGGPVGSFGKTGPATVTGLGSFRKTGGGAPEGSAGGFVR